MIHPCK